MTKKEKKFNAEKKEALRKNACDIAKVLINSALEIVKDPEKRGLIKMTRFQKLEDGGIIVGCDCDNIIVGEL